MEETKILKVGYAEIAFTPPMGMHIPGYFNVRLSEGVINDILIRCVAFDNGEEKALYFACDAQGVTNQGYEAITTMLSEEHGVKKENIIIHASHSHTTAYIMDYNDPGAHRTELTRTYAARLHRQISDVARFALEDLAPAKIMIASGKAEGVGFIRRYEMKDGTYCTNPAWGNPDILRPSGTQDESVQIARIIREEAKEIVLVNFGTHPDTLGGRKYWGDWPAYVVEYLNRTFDNEIHAVMINGCQGNSNHWNKMKPQDVPLKGVNKAKRMARIIAGEVLKIYDACEEIPCTTIKGIREYAIVGQNPCEPDEIELAKKVNALYREYKTSEHPEIIAIRKETRMSVPKANRIIANLNGPDHFEIGISGLQIGNLAFIGFSGEPFCEIGIAVKEKSKMAMTMCSCCSNGGNGYFPTPEAFAVIGGYENVSSRFAHNVANVLVDTSLSIIDKMTVEE